MPEPDRTRSPAASLLQPLSNKLPWTARLSLVFKVQILITLMLVILFTVSLLLSDLVLKNNFLQFEKVDAAGHMNRAKLFLQQQQQSVANTAQDYGQWDDTIEFMLRGRKNYLASNYTFNTFNNTDIDMAVLIKPDGSIAYHGLRRGVLSNEIVDAADDRLDLVPGDILEPLRSAVPIKQFIAREDAAAGILFINSVPFILGLSPILTTSGQGPVGGVMVMAKILNQRRLEQYSREINIALSLTEVPAAEANNGSRLIMEDNRWIISESTPTLFNQSSCQFSVAGTRTLASQLRTSRLVLYINLAVMGCICVLLVGYALHKTVLKRLHYFSATADRIRKTHDTSLRMPQTGNDELDHLAMAINDLLDELRSAHERLMVDALHDTLTGLGNRTLLTVRLQLLQALLTQDSDNHFALYLINLDNFKHINEGFGPDAGDVVLQEVGRRIKQNIREVDAAVRLSGDEFAVVRVNIDQHTDHEQYGRALQTAISEPIAWQNRHLHVTASIGIFASETDCVECSPSDYMRDLDIAMFNAKQKGNNQVIRFNCSMRDVVTARSYLKQDLRTAVSHGNLAIWYQPIISCRNEHIESAEALVRWFHPLRGMITPDIFIPLAEEDSTVVAIDRWVLREAIDGLLRLRQTDPRLKISVNFSAMQIIQPDMVELVSAMIRENGLDANCLNIEITETALVRNEAALVKPIQELIKHNIHIHLDDFGSGYSSLNRLLYLPVSALKLDRSFIHRLDKNDTRFLKSLIDLAHALNKTVIAEGVETLEQKEILIDLGCDLMQGYYFFKPMPEVDFIKHLADAVKITSPRM